MILLNTLEKEEVRKCHYFKIFPSKVLLLAVVGTQNERKQGSSSIWITLQCMHCTNSKKTHLEWSVTFMWPFLILMKNYILWHLEKK